MLAGRTEMKVSRTMAYAIHATLQLARGEPGVPIPCSKLAREGRMPERFLLQILRNLVNQGLLRSTRGVDGGYYLSQPPEKISMLDIFEAFDNPLIPSVPPLEGLSQEIRAKILQTFNRVSAMARKEFSNLSMADLLKEERVEEHMEGC